MTSTIPNKDAWIRARDRYTEDLTQDEKQVYHQAGLENVFYSASAAQKCHESNNAIRDGLAKLQPIIDAIEQYGQAFDVYANAYSLVLSPLWGSLRVIFHLAREFNKYFEKIIDMFVQIGDVLPQFRVYERLFGDRERLIQSLSVVYVDILRFCSDAKVVFKRGQRASTTNFKIAFKLIWKPFQRQFGAWMNAFREHKRNVEKEAGIAHMIEAADARNAAREHQMKLQEEKKEDLRSRLLNALSGIDCEQKHARLQRLRHEGTGEWLLENEDYQGWRSSTKPGYLCCHGIPGSGKSVLMSKVIDQLTDTDSPSPCHVIYYYYDYAEPESLEAREMLGSVLRQMLTRSLINEDTEEDLLKYYKVHQRRPTNDKMIGIIFSMVQNSNGLYFIFDGLDECDKSSQESLLELLDRLEQITSSNFKVLLTCRDGDRILQSLDTYRHISISASYVAADIASYVSSSVESRVDTGQLRLADPTLKLDIIDQLVVKSQGMFLWIYFQLEDICEAASDAMIRETLCALPDGLGETYERILVKISKSSNKKVIAKKVLGWAACARRPLHISEMQEAVAFDGADEAWDSSKLPDAVMMVGACHSLIICDEVDQSVRFAHHTVQQYLISHVTGEAKGLGITSSEIELTAAQLCITYLCFGDFQTAVTPSAPRIQFERSGILGPSGPGLIPNALGLGKPVFNFTYRLFGGTSREKFVDIDYEKYYNTGSRAFSTAIDDKYALLDYIKQYWSSHTSSIDYQHHPELYRTLVDLICLRTLTFEFRPWGSNRHFGPYGCSSCPKSGPDQIRDLPFSSLLHWAAENGHLPLFDMLEWASRNKYQIQSDLGSLSQYVNHEWESAQTLSIACSNGQTEVVRYLLQRFRFHKPVLHECAVAACTSGDVSTLESFERFSQYNLRNNGSELMHIAASRGFEATTRYLISQSAACVIDDITGRGPIHSAAANGHLEVVKALAYTRDSRDATKSTALHYAAQSGHDAIVHFLIHSGSSPDQVDRLGVTALMKAAMGGHVEVIKILFQTSSLEDTNGSTALHYAAQYGRDAAVNILLDYGLRSRHVDKSRVTPLMKAASNGHADVVKTLMKTLDVQDSHGSTALQYAARRGHDAIVKLILESETWSQQPGKDRTIALKKAVHSGQTNVMQILLDVVVDHEVADLDLSDVVALLGYLNSFDIWHSPAICGDLHKIEDLLASHPPDERTPGGVTALQWAAISGALAAAEILVDRGANVDAVSDQGLSATHYAAALGRSNILSLLSKHGANIETPDGLGTRPLHLAIAWRQREALRTLIQIGAEINPTHYHHTWYCAAVSKDVQILDIVLKSGAQFPDDNEQFPYHLEKEVPNFTEAILQRFLTHVGRPKSPSKLSWSDQGSDFQANRNFALTLLENELKKRGSGNAEPTPS